MKRRMSILGGLFALVSASLGGVSLRPPGQRVVPYLAVHLGLTLLSLVAYRETSRRRNHPDLQGILFILCASGIAARALLVPLGAFTTTDTGRYLWDGAVALSGLDPYALSPMAPALASLRQSFPLPVDHHDVATCYPPLAILVFSLASATGPALAFYAWKLWVFLASSLTVIVAWRELRESAQPERLALLALSPLLVMESGVGAHLDTFTSLFVVLSLGNARRARWERAALWVGCAGAIKLIPALLAIPLFFAAPRKLRFAALSSVPLGASMAFAFALGMTPPGSLGYVAQNWSFAAPLWTLLYHFFPYDDLRTRGVLGALGTVLIVGLSLRRTPIEQKLRDAYGAVLALSPVLYPWYGTPLATLSAFAPTVWSVALLAALPLSYEVLDGYQSTGHWSPHRWPMVVIVASAGLGAIVDGVMRWRAKTRRVTRVVLFARAPEIGRVKTRLARAVGEPRALEFYRWIGARIVRGAQSPEGLWELHVAFTPEGSEEAMRRWLGGGVSLGAQGEGELGERMERAVITAFSEGFRRVILVGTDCAAVDHIKIREALEVLERNDVVLGPARDGGYYLLGLKALAPVFQGMTFSTDTVAAETRERLRAAGLSLGEIAPETDVDEVLDLGSVAHFEDAPAWVKTFRSSQRTE